MPVSASYKKILSKKEPEKSLLLNLKARAGRNNQGRITVRHQGAGVKRLYRIIDFGQKKMDVEGKVIALEYDPYRTAFIALIEYPDKEKTYHLASSELKVGDSVVCSQKAVIKPGNRMEIKNVPVGISVFNIELETGRGGKMARSAGSFASVLAHEGEYTNIKMPSGEVRRVFCNCFATVGEVSNPEWRYVNIRKAGSSRRLGIRPRVRGTAMNPVDHPHGGGEGRTPIGLKYPKTPWGKHALGVKTRNKKKWTKKYILQRRTKKQ